MHNFEKGRPKIAIIDPNTLSALGLKQILQNVLPIMTVDTFGSFLELSANKPDEYFHYFTAMNIVLENMAFFQKRRQKTIVLTLSLDTMSQLSEFNCLCTNVTEEKLIRSVLMLQQHAHGHGEHMPPMPKEIADKLNIGLSTVITHRKNIMDKLGMKSVSALTIYAVMHGYVDINKI